MANPSLVVLCTGNSCRSQMTAAWIRHLAPQLVVHSAGVRPSKALHATAVEMMAEVGVDVVAMGESPKHWETWTNQPLHDIAIFTCPKAEAACPEWNRFASTKLSWPTEDPGDFEGPADEKLANFRKVRDEIRHKVQTWLTQQGLIHVL